MKRFFLGLMSLLLAMPIVAYAAEDDADNIPYVAIPPAENLEALGKRSELKTLPILLVVTQTDCPYCELLKAEVIRPMILSGEYEDLVLIRELNLDGGERVVDFNGVIRSTQDFASGYRAWLTPTLLFLDGKGKQVAKKIRGVNTVELFSFYVDESIEKAKRALEVRK